MRYFLATVLLVSLIGPSDGACPDCNGVEDLCGVKLTTVGFAGTHNSLSAGINQCPSNFNFFQCFFQQQALRTQTASLISQLNNGIRALDFDFCAVGSDPQQDPRQCHQAVYGPLTATQIFNQISTFLTDNPCETVLVRLSDVGSIDGGSDDIARIQTVTKLLQSDLNTSGKAIKTVTELKNARGGNVASISEVSLGDVQGKAIIFFTTDDGIRRIVEQNFQTQIPDPLPEYWNFRDFPTGRFFEEEFANTFDQTGFADFRTSLNNDLDQGFVNWPLFYPGTPATTNGREYSTADYINFLLDNPPPSIPTRDGVLNSFSGTAWPRFSGVFVDRYDSVNPGVVAA
eukprot:Cvel_30990.t2-p1 / transcript=Cvel_30990.t2 / gene=Cvel_30990 / organism=Chromera_velia_CCMP2878 / gene_product=hypothetical protein / transcript_product=hypothetical protein / location=Cvel_scaffold4528:4653-5681(+) / protein_length=343 / sequence_SO=supercontig / SO=protein_coding / is_pseudo=false